ncbi:MAG: SGNH/GDSL hydrolase family protein [Chthoniobacterales bacterium]
MNRVMDAGDEFPAFKPDDRILFQGDSITDAGRTRDLDPNVSLGGGYVFIIAARAGAIYPERHLTFLNRGVSANKIYDLASRWQTDTVELKPALVSVLVGINDTVAEVSPKDYEAAYEKLLAQTMAALPSTRLVLCEPFALAAGFHKKDFEGWRAAVGARGRIVGRLAAKYGAAFVRFQQIFDEACKRAPAEYWSRDGVHPTAFGHQIMAEEWIRAVSEFRE